MSQETTPARTDPISAVEALTLLIAAAWECQRGSLPGFESRLWVDSFNGSDPPCSYIDWAAARLAQLSRDGRLIRP